MLRGVAFLRLETFNIISALQDLYKEWNFTYLTYFKFFVGYEVLLVKTRYATTSFQFSTNSKKNSPQAVKDKE